jgi:general secretion pathway protein E
MPGFRYQAYSLEGKLARGVLEADSARQARSLLRDQGLTPYRVEVIAANDAPGAVTRLIDMGIEPYLLASTLNAVLAQRLVRRLCRECRAPYEPDAAERSVFGRDAPDRLYKAVGCGACNFSGYKGRTGIYELFVADDTSRHMVHDGTAEAELRAHAVRAGMLRLREDGLRWVREGVTSLDEVLRVTRT